MSFQDIAKAKNKRRIYTNENIGWTCSLVKTFLQNWKHLFSVVYAILDTNSGVANQIGSYFSTTTLVTTN